MRNPIKQVQDTVRFRLAKARIPKDQVLCGTFSRDGKPIYFGMAPDADDFDVQLVAFEQREGRKMNTLERQLFDIARGNQ